MNVRSNLVHLHAACLNSNCASVPIPSILSLAGNAGVAEEKRAVYRGSVQETVQQ